VRLASWFCLASRGTRTCEMEPERCSIWLPVFARSSSGSQNRAVKSQDTVLTAHFYIHCMYQRDGQSLLFVFRFLLHRANKPSHDQRYENYDDESTAQRFQLMMIISDSHTVTTINNATYWKAMMIGRDEQEITLWRSQGGLVFHRSAGSN
jgi:hypothetical protein